MTVHYYKVVKKDTGKTAYANWGWFDDFKTWQAEESRGAFKVIEITRDEYKQIEKH